MLLIFFLFLSLLFQRNLICVEASSLIIEFDDVENVLVYDLDVDAETTSEDEDFVMNLCISATICLNSENFSVDESAHIPRIVSTDAIEIQLASLSGDVSADDVESQLPVATMTDPEPPATPDTDIIVAAISTDYSDVSDNQVNPAVYNSIALYIKFIMESFVSLLMNRGNIKMGAFLTVTLGVILYFITSAAMNHGNI